MRRIGVLALQGDFAAHAKSLVRLGTTPVEVRRVHQLEDISGLVLPGGESTTLLNLMQDEPWFDALREFHAAGGSLLGTCAGAILLARRVVEPEQDSLGLLDVVIARNGYGRQYDSFEETLEIQGLAQPVRGVFIRAPRFRQWGPDVDVLASRGAEPVLVRQGRVVAATFHPELTADVGLHRLFLHLLNDAVGEPPRPTVSSGAGPDTFEANRRIPC